MQKISFSHLMVEHDADRVSEIKTPHSGMEHRNFVKRFRVPVSQRLRESFCFLSEYEEIHMRGDRRIGFRCFSFNERKSARELIEQEINVVMDFHIEKRPVIEPGTLKIAVIRIKSKGWNEVQARARSRRKSTDAACVLGDFRLIKGNV